ncbi:medium chain dehydrogenase/reductase family protein [Streptomyces bauhiniae]|uniref:medium chain dehydrogenase/reductase family protein n=1 Tax=Streptomyces bauhiniae TaxID=2340725 RepID=UPI0035DD7D0C
MSEMRASAEATVTVTEVLLPGKVAPSGLRLVRRALPAPAAGQARVRVESTAVSFAERAMSRGRYYGQPPFPFVPGYDLVGVVEAVGPGVDPALVGRRVAALTKTGGWTTAALLTAADLVEVPDGIDPDEAETLIVNGLTAYQMLHRSAKVRAGQTVLVLGAAGGVGSVLVQLAKDAGARVIGTAAPRHHQPLRALGVEPIDYRDPDLAARVRELAPGGVDAVFDHLGGASASLSYRLLNRSGTLVSYSIAAKLDDTRPLLLDFLPLLARLTFWNYLPTRRHATFYDVWAGAGKPDSAKREAFRSRMRTDLTHLFGLLRDGVLTARIAARFPLDEVVAAMDLAESSARTDLGKIILTP